MKATILLGLLTTAWFHALSLPEFPADSCLYYIVSDIGDKVLTVSNRNSAQGAQLEIRDFDEQLEEYQLFSLLEVNNGRFVQSGASVSTIPIYELSHKLYFIRHIHGNVIDLKDADQSNGAKIQLWGFGGFPNHLWELVDAGEGYFYIVNILTGKAIDVPGGRNENGNKVQSFELNRSPAQKWRFQKATKPILKEMINGEPTVIDKIYEFGQETINLQNVSISFIPQKEREWNYIDRVQMGVAAKNRNNHHIGWCPAEWGSSRNNWFPQASKKYTICGELCSIGSYKSESIGTAVTTTPLGGVPDEYDLNLHIKPNNTYWYTTNKDVIDYTSPTGVFDFLEGVPLLSVVNGAEELLTGDCSENWHQCESEYTVEGEVTGDESLISTNNLFLNYKETTSTIETSWAGTQEYIIRSAESRMFINRNLCMYGPYVTEVNHCNKPEIHPSEMLWGNGLTENTKYLIMLQDDSDRFHVKNRFDTDDCTFNPWVTPTLSGEFYIPFELDGLKRITYEVDIELSHEVKTSYYASNIDASEYAGRSKKIVSKGKTLLEVVEKQRNPEDLATRFELFRSSTGKVLGYLVVSAAVGENLNGKEGYLIIRLTKKTKGYPQRPGYVEVIPIMTE